MEGRPDRGRHRRQSTHALWRALCRVPRSRAGLRLFPVHRRQGRRRFPQRRDLAALQGHLRPHRSRRRHPVQSAAQWRLSHPACKSARDNLVLWKFEKGRRSSVKWIRNTPTPTRTWHDLKVRIAGKKVEGYLDGKLTLEHDLPAPVAGRVGLWSKADSYVYFDDYTVMPADAR